jgi:16S rRNA (uracil1498-N3)-methyltransferase
MRQFLLPASFNDESELTLRGEDYHYLCRVLRYAEGDRFPAVAHDGARYRAQLVSVGADSCRLSLERSTEQDWAGAGSPLQAADSARLPTLTLLQCMPKGQGFETIVRSATQVGVQHIVPVYSDRTVRRLKSQDDVEKKRERWERIAREAVQQSGNPQAPALYAPRSIDALPPKEHDATLRLYFHEKPIAQHSLHGYLKAEPREVELLIGPEGGLSQRELSSLEQNGFLPAYLGPHVLRTETAAVYALAAIQIIALESDSWS